MSRKAVTWLIRQDNMTILCIQYKDKMFREGNCSVSPRRWNCGPSTTLTASVEQYCNCMRQNDTIYTSFLGRDCQSQIKLNQLGCAPRLVWCYFFTLCNTLKLWHKFELFTCIIFSYIESFSQLYWSMFRWVYSPRYTAYKARHRVIIGNFYTYTTIQ